MKSSNYPDSMVERNRYLEKTVKNLHDTCKSQDDEIQRLQCQLEIFREASDTSEETIVHRWQGDGYDHLESIVRTRPILITVDQLRQLLIDKAEFVKLF